MDKPALGSTDHLITADASQISGADFLRALTGRPPLTRADIAEREAAIARHRAEATIRKAEFALASAQCIYRKGEPWGEFVTRYHAAMDAAEARIAARIAELDDEREAARHAALDLTVEQLTGRAA